MGFYAAGAPGVGRTSGKRSARALWFGQRVILLIGPAPDAGLAEFTAPSDQTDGWAALHFGGAGAQDVLARMTPLDLRLIAFKRGHTARSDCAHMPASITRLGDAAFQIMVFRSMAATLVHELKTAMARVVALQ
ncbi:MAG: sarcosine oxidase subunit gamma [Roseovarius sp.]|nr:sarcosine oxidase subunit gamma [Roseovarius sp.]